MLKLLSILTFSLFLTVPAPAETVICNEGVSFDENVGQIAQESTRDCQKELNEYKKLRGRLGSSLNDKNNQFTENEKAICTCLGRDKFNILRISPRRRLRFNNWEYDQTIREKLAYSLKDLIGNFTKFNNLLLTKDHLGNIASPNQNVCTIKSLANEVSEIQKLQGTDKCRSPKGFMHARVQEIFGTTKMDELANKLDVDSKKIDSQSCLSNQMYLNLRSSSGAASTGFKLLLSNLDFKKRIENPGSSDLKGPLKDLLSYDVIFNLAYRDGKYKESLRKKIQEYEAAGGRRFDIYNNKEVLELTYSHLNESCLELTKNIKNFLCAGEYPKMNTAVLNMHLDDYFEDEKIDKSEKDSMRDHFTYEFACKESKRALTEGYTAAARRMELPKPLPRTDGENEFNAYLEKTILVKNVTKDVFSENPKSDYSKFNEMFCKGVDPKNFTPDNLPGMLGSYIKNLRKKNIDIMEVLGNENVQKQLGLKISLDKNGVPEFSLLKPEDIAAGKLPKINQFTWNKVVIPLLKDKLPPEEIGQLYAMIEMQTNRKFTETEDVKARLIADKSPYQGLNLIELNGVARKDETIIKQIKERQLTANPSSTEFNDNLETSIGSSYTTIKKDQQATNSDSQNVLFGKKTIAEVKAEAETYNGQGRTHTPERKTLNDGSGQESNPTVSQTPQTGQQITQPGSTTGSGNLGANSSSSSNNADYTPEYASVPETKALPVIQPQTSGGGSSISSNSNSSSNDDSSSNLDSGSSRSPASVSKYNPDEDPEIKALQDDIERSKKRYKELTDRANRERSASSNSALTPSTSSSSGTSSRSVSNSSRRLPSNVPIKSPSGDYYYPKSDVQELSSNGADSGKGKAEGSDHGDKAAGGGGGSVASGAADATSAGGTGAASAGAASAIAGVGKNLPGREPGSDGASTEKEDEARKRQNLSVYEHHKVIPHAIVDVVGSIEKAVILLKLEGKRFKTIEGVEVNEKNSTESSVKYYIRTFDFVPEGDFSDYKEDFANKEAREKAHKLYFSFPRTKENLKVSQKFAKATKEVGREEVNHNFVLKMQKDIMTEHELRDQIQKISEDLK